MSFENAVLQEYSFDRTVFIRFMGRKDFSLARYHSISLEGFSCYCNKPLNPGELNTVEVNLKMITRGLIDDIVPHFASVKFTRISHEDGQQICWFKFIDFKNSCFDNLINALLFLEEKEKVISIPVPPKPGTFSTVDEVIHEILQKTENGHFVLPVLPKIVREVDGLVRRPDTTIEDLALAIERDSVISVKVLATANSPFYRTDEQINSIRETIPRLGFKETRNLILTIANKSLYNVKNKYYKQLLQDLWNHSLTCAHCAKAIAEYKQFNDVDGYYTAGLIHDVGKTVFFRFLSDMNIDNASFSESDIVSGTEKHNPDMTDIVLRHWEFPGRFINAITMKHETDFKDPANKLRLVIEVANALSRNMGFDIVDDVVDLTTVKAVQQLGLDLISLNRINEEVLEKMDRAESAF